jgi:DNA-binding YbaB/EbfC family protein
MNPLDLLKTFGNIQEKLRESQEKLKTIEAVGSAGGDMVQVVLSGDMAVKSVRISSEAVDPEDIEMLQDLITAAHADALYKIREKISEEMSSLTGGMPIPPEFMGR